MFKNFNFMLLIFDKIQMKFSNKKKQYRDRWYKATFSFIWSENCNLVRETEIEISCSDSLWVSSTFSNWTITIYLDTYFFFGFKPMCFFLLILVVDGRAPLIFCNQIITTIKVIPDRAQSFLLKNFWYLWSILFVKSTKNFGKISED